MYPNVDDEVILQRLSESSKFCSELLGHAQRYVKNPEDVAPREYSRHNVPPYTVPHQPDTGGESAEAMCSDGEHLSLPPFQSPFLFAKGISKWRIDSSSSDFEKIGRSITFGLLGKDSSLMQAASFHNHFPACAPNTPMDCSPGNITERLLTLGFSSQAAQNALKSARAIVETDNHLAMLTLAWTYILSALWAESQKGKIEYSLKASIQRHVHEDPVTDEKLDKQQVVFVPGNDGECFCWWRQLLLQPMGWLATIEHCGSVYHSPWHILLRTTYPGFRVVSSAPWTVSNPPCAATALGYLAMFCHCHGLTEQAKTALAAALIIPTHTYTDCPPVNLPKPVHAVDIFAATSPTSSAPVLLESPILGYNSKLSRLMTISAIGVMNLLLGVLYEPDKPSTFCGEWCKPAVVNWPESTSHDAVLGCLRAPILGRWWIGAGVTSLITPWFQGNSMLWHTNLQLAIWTGSAELSPHSQFCHVLTKGITLRSDIPTDEDSCYTGTKNPRLILRADEILATFLTSGRGPEARLARIPPAPFHPPGYAELDKSSLDIIRAANANASLRLVFVDWAWETRSDISDDAQKWDSVQETHTPIFSTSSGSRDVVERDHTMTDVSKLIGGAQSHSENVTRSIMDWLEGHRGIEADEQMGDMDFEKLFEAYND